MKQQPLDLPEKAIMGISLAEKTVNNFIKKALRLYEQEPPPREGTGLASISYAGCLGALGAVSTSHYFW